MKADATSLDRLHDLVLPPAVSWWPLAPGWYVVCGLLVLGIIWLSWRSWQRWRAESYRREALHQLQQLQNAPAIAELLRRTALAVVPRSHIAVKTGSAWADWLADQCAETMSPEVKKVLCFGVYGRSDTKEDVRLLRNYAARWIRHHRRGFLHIMGKKEE